jgi:hypothetical protein
MKRFIIALCVLYLVSIFALAQGTKDQAPQPDAKLAKELMAIHQQWLEDEWTITTYNGHIINKEQGLADAKTSNQKDRLIGTHDNLIARAYGNTAVLTYRSKTQDGYIQTIQVWVKRQGRWQRVASQSTKLAEQQPQ